MKRTSALSTLQNSSFRKGTLRLFVFVCLFFAFFFCFFASILLERINLKLLTTEEIFSYRPDHFPIFVGRSTCFLGAMFKKATHQPLLVNVCQLTRRKVLFKRFTVTVVKLGVFF